MLAYFDILIVHQQKLSDKNFSWCVPTLLGAANGSVVI